MHSIPDLIAANGGVASIDYLRQRGASARAVQRAEGKGEISRVRRGWYAGDDANPQVVRAVRAGGALACVSGCGFWGIWQPWEVSLHISVLHGARHIKDPDSGGGYLPKQRSGAQTGGGPRGLVLHWDGRSGDGPRFVVPLIECLAQVVRCQPPDVAFAIIESALRKNKLGCNGPERLAELVPHSRRDMVSQARGSADSGTESLFRYRMLQLGVSMKSQVTISGVGRVDFVIGDRLVVEIDSTNHHNRSEDRIRDLGRDAILAGLGFICLRFDYQMVIWDWNLVESTVLAVVGRGEHLSAVRFSR